MMLKNNVRVDVITGLQIRIQRFEFSGSNEVPANGACVQIVSANQHCNLALVVLKKWDFRRSDST